MPSPAAHLPLEELTEATSPSNYHRQHHHQPQRHKYFLGLFFILLQCLVWIGAAILTQYLYTEHSDALSPFLLTYIGMSLLSLMLPANLVWERLRVLSGGGVGVGGGGAGIERHDDKSAIATISMAQHSFDSMDAQLQQATNCTDYINTAHYGTKQLWQQAQQQQEQTQQQGNIKMKRWNHKKHLLAALWLVPAMFLADWAFNAALSTTSVASATVLVSTQSVFVLVLAVLARLEHFSISKLIGVLLTVCGTALTALQDSEQVEKSTNDEDSSHAIVGDILAVFAAVMYACYTVLVRLFCPQDEELYQMTLLLGYIGLICFLALLPVGLYILVMRVDLTLIVFAMIVTKGMLDFTITDYCLFRAIVLTNATVATVGLGMTIPMAFLADLVVYGDTVTTLSAFGAVAVSIGFLIVNLATENEEKKLLLETIDETDERTVSSIVSTNAGDSNT